MYSLNGKKIFTGREMLLMDIEKLTLDNSFYWTANKVGQLFKKLRSLLYLNCIIKPLGYQP